MDTSPRGMPGFGHEATHLEPRDGALGEPPAPPTLTEFAAASHDGRQGDAISDQPFGDETRHQQARDAVAWDETTNT